MANLNGEPLTLMDLITFVKNSYQLLLRKWKMIFLCALVGGILGMAFAFVKVPIYKAVLTFSIEDKGGMGAYSAVASQLGIDMPKSDGGAFKGDNIIEVFKAQSTIEKALLTQVEIGQQKMALIDMYLKSNPILGAEMKDTKQFPISYTNRRDYSRFQDSLLHVVSMNLQRNSLRVDKMEKNLSIIKVVFTSPDEEFSEKFLVTLSKTVYDLYVDSKVAKLKNNISVLESRVDSVKKELNSELSGAANTQDQNQNASLARVRIPYLQRQLNIQLLTAMHAELVKNLEFSKLTLAREEPLIQVIDSPIPPLDIIKPSVLYATIIAAFVVALACAVILILLDVLKKVQVKKVDSIQ